MPGTMLSYCNNNKILVHEYFSGPEIDIDTYLEKAPKAKNSVLKSRFFNCASDSRCFLPGDGAHSCEYDESCLLRCEAEMREATWL